MLKSYYKEDVVEAGCDEAGRGCLAGSVFAAAVIFQKNYENPDINDSKQLTAHERDQLRQIIIRDAQAWAVGMVTPKEIDHINILNASILAMHRALDLLHVRPGHIIVDGNRFRPYHDVPFQTVVKGDGKFLSIAAASILAKTFRDDYMMRLHQQFPYYGWDHNMGYPTPAHREGIRKHGASPYHRLSFNLLPPKQLLLFPQ